MVRISCRWLLISLLLLSPLFAKAEQARYTTDAVGFVPYWIGLGPIPVSAAAAVGPGLDTPLFAGEATLKPHAEDVTTINGKKYHWRLVTVKDGKPYVDLGQAGFGNAANVAALLVSYVVLDKDQNVTVLWGCGDSGALYVNGKPLGRFVGKRWVKPDTEAAVNVPLHKGVNTFMLKILCSDDFYWGGVLRLADANDVALKNITIGLGPSEVNDPGARSWPDADTGQEPLAGPIATYLIASQIGYNTSEEKLAIATSLRERAWKSVEIRDAATDKTVYTVPTDGGSIEPTGQYKNVNQYISRVYFGPFRTPGRYYLYHAETGVKSMPFNIGDNVYEPVFKEAARAFYYQRSGINLEEKYAGKWAMAAYHDIETAKKGQVAEWDGRVWASGVGDKVIDPTPRDVRGGWYDAGDPNKYTKNEVFAHNLLLQTWDMNKKYLKDNNLNIPESGNGVPDLLDEVRFTTDFLFRIQRADGAVFDRVAMGSRMGDHGEKLDPPTRIAEPTSGATLCAISAWAWAAAVWKEGGWDPKFADRCLQAAEKSWKYMQAHPAPWPLGADGKPRSVGSIDSGANDPAGYGDQNMWKSHAASALYRATGKPEYKAIAEAFLKNSPPVELGYKVLTDQVCHNYMLSKEPDSALVKSYADRLAKFVHDYRDDASRTSKKLAYGSEHTLQYHWGSDGAVALRTGVMLWWASYFAPKEEMPSYVQAADEYMQYLLGRNPTRWAYITNLQHIGATRSPQVMFHTENRGMDEPANKWLTPDADHPNRIGAFPGYLVGGPAENIGDFLFDPYKVQNDFIRMEPSVMYQAPLVFLTAYLAYGSQEYRH